MNFLQLWFEFSGTLLEVRNAIEKLVSELLYAVLFLFSDMQQKILNIRFLSLGWVDVDHVITRKMQLIAEAEVNHNTCLWCGAGQLTLEVFWRVTSPGTQIALFSPRLSAVTFPQPSFSLPLSTRGVVLCNEDLSYLTPIDWSPKIRMNFETCK